MLSPVVSVMVQLPLDDEVLYEEMWREAASRLARAWTDEGPRLGPEGPDNSMELICSPCCSKDTVPHAPEGTQGKKLKFAED
ncbi:hypothetical protein H920_14791 [Fukomys damarensis]|uniref:Uncharacterized protein n=1 Tax=Fukomys damarensis TaxID=885580 RepID=A0A091CYN5_FUKDA|nr:hypothetical protein H920_14791 [Fukomys damarensis]